MGRPTGRISFFRLTHGTTHGISDYPWVILQYIFIPQVVSWEIHTVSYENGVSHGMTHVTNPHG